MYVWSVRKTIATNKIFSNIPSLPFLSNNLKHQDREGKRTERENVSKTPPTNCIPKVAHKGKNYYDCCTSQQ